MDKAKRQKGRPRKGEEIRERLSIRLEPTVKKIIIAKYGSVQAWIDSNVHKL
jgi:hypothetical protein